MNGNNITEQFLKLLKKISEKKVYGSVEIYFEEGRVTQITQRIIKKINNKKEKAPLKKVPSGGSNSTNNLEKIEDSLTDLII